MKHYSAVLIAILTYRCVTFVAFKKAYAKNK